MSLREKKVEKTFIDLHKYSRMYFSSTKNKLFMSQLRELCVCVSHSHDKSSHEQLIFSLFLFIKNFSNFFVRGCLKLARNFFHFILHDSKCKRILQDALAHVHSPRFVREFRMKIRFYRKIWKNRQKITVQWFPPISLHTFDVIWVTCK